MFQLVDGSYVCVVDEDLMYYINLLSGVSFRVYVIG
jgi:hypothetical protein